MSKVQHVVGKYVSGRHTTVTPLAKEIFTFLQTLSTFDRGSPGIIMPEKKIKVPTVSMQNAKTHIVLKVVGHSSMQELRVYCTKEENAIQKTMEQIAKWVRNKSIQLRFPKLVDTK